MTRATLAALGSSGTSKIRMLNPFAVMVGERLIGTWPNRALAKFWADELRDPKARVEDLRRPHAAQSGGGASRESFAGHTSKSGLSPSASTTAAFTKSE